MTNDMSEFSKRLTAISEADQVITLRANTLHALALLNIRGAYSVAPLTVDPRTGRLLTNYGLSRVWERHYRARLHLFDPLPGIALRQSEAFNWPECTLGKNLEEKQSRYLEIAAKHGLVRGIGMACYGPHGRSGFLGLVRESSEPAPNSVLQQAQIIGQTGFGRYCMLVSSDTVVPPLSNRELEVLGWMCEGKSNTVIAQILAISPSSVDMYVRRLFAKLEVGDRTAACLRGYNLGLTGTREFQRLIEAEQVRNPDDTL